MNINETLGEPVICEECGKKFYNPDKWVKLAGHIARSVDHDNKRWAVKYLQTKNMYPKKTTYWNSTRKSMWG